MKGTITVLSETGEVMVEKPFVSRLAYMHTLADLMENFRQHRIEITFESAA